MCENFKMNKHNFFRSFKAVFFFFAIGNLRRRINSFPEMTEKKGEVPETQTLAITRCLMARCSRGSEKRNGNVNVAVAT